MKNRVPKTVASGTLRSQVTGIVESGVYTRGRRDPSGTLDYQTGLALSGPESEPRE
jgi:hypothetical protein